MASPYSLDLRERVIALVDGGAKPAEAGKQFQVSERTIWGWLALRKETGELKPRKGDVGPERKLEEYRERILHSVKTEPGLTLPERREKLNLPGCPSTLWSALRRWGVTIKKSPERC